MLDDGVGALFQQRTIAAAEVSRAALQVPFAPCIEVAWRLAPQHWGQGYATEAALASLSFAFGVLHLEEVLAWTTPANRPSRRVMEKLGMTRDPSEDFDHPGLPEGHPLRRHVLYRIRSTAAPVRGI